MPKSRTRKNKRKTSQVIHIQVKKPIGPREITGEDGKVHHVTDFVVYKSNKTRTVKHLPQKH